SMGCGVGNGLWIKRAADRTGAIRRDCSADGAYNAGMRRSRRPAHRLLFGVVAAWLLASAGAIPAGQVEAPTSFASRIAQLSEPGGYFDADNLISNEKSYLQEMSALGDARLAGGAYIGVGPYQNFSYIAQL